MRNVVKSVMVMIVMIVTNSVFGMSGEKTENETSKKAASLEKVEEAKNLTQSQILKLHQKYLKSLSKFGKKQNRAVNQLRKGFNPGSGKNTNVKGVKGCLRDSSGNAVKRSKSYK